MVTDPYQGLESGFQFPATGAQRDAMLRSAVQLAEKPSEYLVWACDCPNIACWIGVQAGFIEATGDEHVFMPHDTESFIPTG
jgi:hypothetical protein